MVLAGPCLSARGGIAQRDVDVENQLAHALHPPHRHQPCAQALPNLGQAAVAAVKTRCWREYSEIRLCAATEDITPSAIGRFISPVVHMVEEINESERQWIEKLADNALQALRSAGTPSSLHIHAGNPKEVLVDEAEHWDADCIFVGANAFGSRVERFLLGSTSAAVAARAHCSVEVVRKQV